MLEESLFKTNFIGRDGFRWWIGQVAPVDAWQDQADGGGWGNRVKVRIMGYHPYSETELSNDDLPWAQVLLGTTDGSGAANRSKTPKVSQADTVFGFFLDGDNAQLPCVVGVFGRTKAVSSSGPYSAPFQPFTGYSGAIKKSSAVVNNESNESNTTSQKSPRMVSPEIAEKLNKETEDPTEKEVSGFSAIGQKVTMATAKVSSEIDDIKTDIENFVSSIQDIVKGITDGIGDFTQQVNERVDAITNSIQSGATGLIHNMTKGLSEAMGGAMNKGLDVLYKGVYATVLAATGSSKAADIAGIAAQATFISPVKAISDALPCIANSVIGGIGGMIKGLLTNIADNVTNFVTCIADQGMAAIMNTIIGGITKALQPFLGGVGKILGGFNPFGFLTTAVDAFQNVTSALDCNEAPADYALASNEWTIGVGTNEGAGTPVGQILETANKARELAQTGFGVIDAVQDIAGLTGSLGVFDFANPSVSVPGFESVLGNCYAGPPELGGCGGTKIKIFGGKGIGGVANAIIGLANADRGVTGSLLGVDLVNGGGGYTTPPFVEIVDECKSGYGAVARAIIDKNPNSPTYTQITDIVLVSGGEGYTPSVDSPSDVIVDPIKPATIYTGGTKYTSEDTASDNLGNVYDIEVNENGSIINVVPSTKVERIFPSVNELPTRGIQEVEIEISSSTGFGAILKPRFTRRPVDYQGDVRLVIDCISKDDDLVGYVNGKAYYGPYHLHPTNGRKMTGATHTGDGQYISDVGPLVGYVNGQPYAGPSHINSRTGKKMTGLSETSSSKIIYDTKSESESLSDIPLGDGTKPQYSNGQVGYVNGNPYYGPYHIHNGKKMTGESHTDDDGGGVTPVGDATPPVGGGTTPTSESQGGGISDSQPYGPDRMIYIDDDLVGFVNGKEYYGPFHSYQGYPMTGPFHTGSGNYIHRTKSGSITQQFPERGWVTPRSYRTQDYYRNLSLYDYTRPVFLDLQRENQIYNYGGEIVFDISTSGPPGSPQYPIPPSQYGYIPGSGQYQQGYIPNYTNTPDAPYDPETVPIEDGYDYMNDPNYQTVTCGLSFCIDADGNVIE